MSKHINVTDGSILESLNNKVDLDGGNYPGSGLSRMINTHHTGLNMFDPVIKDHELSYEESRGLAPQGTWVYKTAVAGEHYGYPDFYAKCLAERNDPDNILTEAYVDWNIAYDDGAPLDSTNTGVITVYSAAPYVPTTYTGTATTAEFTVKLRSPSAWAGILGDQSHNYIFKPETTNCPVSISSAGKLGIYNGSSWILGSTIYPADLSIIWVKLIWNGSSYKVYGLHDADGKYTKYSLPDLSAWKLEATWNTTTNIWSQKLFIGNYKKGSGVSFQGSIDLKHTYININGSRWWNGAHTFDIIENKNGHGYYDIAYQANIDEIFQSKGKAWYYGIDEENERIFMPRDRTNETAVHRLHICVGNVIADTSWVDVVTQVQNGTQDIENTRQNVLNDIENHRQSSLTDMENTRKAGVASIETAKNNSVAAVEVRGAELRSKMALQMFDTISKDHILSYEETPGLALQGTAVYKNAIAGERYGYKDFYNKCLLEYAEGQNITINGATCRKHPNGHIYYEMKDKPLIDQEYTNTGIGHFYGIDTANDCIYLPRVTERRLIASKKPDANLNWYNLYSDGWCEQGGYSLAAAKVTTVTLEIPYIDAKSYSVVEAIGGFDNTAANNAYSQVYKTVDGSSFTISGYSTGAGYRSMWMTQGYTTYTAEGGARYVYFCVGNTPASTAWVDVVTQVNGGVKDLTDKTNEGIAALANAGSALRQTQITNCLLEIPQNIKLELADGVLTLKAGSKIIVPNGFEADGTTPKFDEVVVGSDVIPGSITTEGTTMLFSNSSGTAISYQAGAGDMLQYMYSGSTAPTVFYADKYAYWYDTASNLIKQTTNGGSTWNTGRTLPLCIVSYSSSGITSIDQVFNGFGYIGSTVWVDKGVKGLIPNGKNADGTLNNREITVSKLSLSTVDCTCHIQFLINEYGVMVSLSNYFDEEDPCHYDEDQNYLVNENGDRADVCWVGDFDRKRGVVSNFQIKRPFRALDRNEVKAYVVDTYQSDTGWYRVWSDGWIEQGGTLAVTFNTWATVTFLKRFSNTYYTLTGAVQGANTSYADAFIGWKIDTKTTSSIQLSARYISTKGSGVISWEARGY